MQREEKQMEMFIDNSLTKLKDLKIAIAQMMHKIGEKLKNELGRMKFMRNFVFCRI
jgi:hypothetical protein